MELFMVLCLLVREQKLPFDAKWNGESENETRVASLLRFFLRSREKLALSVRI